VNTHEEEHPAGPDAAAVPISVVVPLGAAWQHMKRILFPVTFRRWISLGFVAWLASLGSGVPNLIVNLGRNGRAARHWMRGMERFLEAYWPLVLAGALIVVAVGLALWVILAYLRSRGIFMYLDAIYSRDCRIGQAWRSAAPLALSFWKWSILLSLLAGAAAIIACVPMLLVVLRHEGQQGFDLSIIPAVAGSVLALLSVGLLHAVARWLMNSLLAPIMYVRRCSVIEAFTEFTRLTRGHLGSVALFFLMHIPLGLLMGMAAVPVLCMTCCLAGLPVVFQTVMQPLYLWLRAYGPHFLAQFGGPYSGALNSSAQSGQC